MDVLLNQDRDIYPERVIGMSARCYEDFCRNPRDIDDTVARVRFFLLAVAFVAAVYGGMVLGSMVLDNLGL